MSLVISSLAADLKKHVADNPTIFQEVMVDLSGQLSRAGIQVYNDVEDQMPLYELSVSDPGQPGDRATEAVKTGVINWKNRTLETKHGEVTLKITNQQINAMYKTHLNEMRNAPARGDVYELPFEEVMIRGVVQRLLDRIAVAMLWKGSHSAAGTTTAAIANGYETLIAADITANNIAAANVFAGAAITAANALTQFHGVLDKVYSQNPEYATQELICYCGPTPLKHYRENYRSTYNALPYNSEFMKNMVNDHPNVRIEPMQGLAGDDRIVITTPNNFVLGTDAFNRLENVLIERRGRDLFIYIDFKIGVNYKLAQEIWCNDQ